MTKLTRAVASPLVAVSLAIIPTLLIGSAKAAPSTSFTVPTAEPPGIDCEKGLQFTKTAAYRKEFKTAVDNAYKFCRKYKAEHPDENVCIVTDLDETLLDNREEIREHGRDWDPFVAWIHEAKAPLLPETAKFLKWARKNGFAIFAVTGRAESDRRATIRNLIRNQVAYDGLYVRAERDETPAEDFKTSVRKQIEALGFTIVVNIGDQFSDLVGGHALDCEKLPNNMYFIK